jgi:long-chain acyl-CoA synthetase
MNTVLREEAANAPGLTAVSHGSPEFHLLPGDQGLFSVVAEGARRHPERPVFARPAATGWLDVTSARFSADVQALAGQLIDWGVGHGERVAVLGRTSYEWAVTDFAVLSIGAVTVPVYPTASVDQVRHILADSGTTYGFAETLQQLELLSAAGDQWQRPPRLLAVPAQGPTPDAVPATFAERSAAVAAGDIATIVYTSGTTGVPKGCVLTHRNMFASSANTVRHEAALFDSAGATTLLCLPLSHIFARTILLSCLFAGVRTGLLSAVPDLFDAMPDFQPTFLALVPYALEKIRKQCRGAWGAEAEQVAVDYARAQWSGATVPEALAAAHAGREQADFAAMRGRLGGRCTHVISGGASLDQTTEAFFAGIGVQILGAYGLTEAATAVTINQPQASLPGSVGQPIPGTTVAIAADGEVLVGGLNVSPGYWPLTAAEREPQWLHTGDLGRLDERGYLFITGRRKEILVTSSGKNVSPTPLEDRVRLHSLVSNCIVVAEGRSFVSALVTLDLGAVGRWAAAGGIGPGHPPWHERPELLLAVQAAIDDANSLVSKAESIRAFRVLDGDFTVGNGQLTASLKLRREVIQSAYQDVIADIYG